MQPTAEPRTWAEIDLSAIHHNLRVAQEKAGRSAGIVAVVKSNAYGHGLIEVARAIADEVAMFGVANVEEARNISALGREILLLSPCLPSERNEAVRSGFVATVSSAAEAAEFRGGTVNFKIDTGMGRIGCWQENALEELETLATLTDVRIHSVSTHLPLADEDATFTHDQLTRFATLVTPVRKKIPGAKIHALNSAGLLEHPEFAFDLVRTGLLLYGSAYPTQYQSLLRPALTWKARVLLVREVGPGRGVSYGRTHVTTRQTRIATLAVGYADGYPRQVSNRGAQVLVGGKRCPVLGRITMDQILVDVTKTCAQAGDEAVLVGRQNDENISARELAESAGTIAWDIFTGLGSRVHHFF